MAKLTEYTAATRFDANDILIKDGTNGTKKITVKNAATEFAGLVSSNGHKNTYRGKNLGTEITAAQQTAIENGTFDDLFIGDYWVLNGNTYYIADMNYWYNVGNTSGGFSPNHLVMIPAGTMYQAKMNTTNTTAGGYIGSYMYTTALAQARSTIQTDFGNLLLEKPSYFTNAVDDGHPSNGVWVNNSKVDLMNEVMLTGNRSSLVGGYESTFGCMDNRQLSIFRLGNKHLHGRKSFWLRDIASATQFIYFNFDGILKQQNASTESGVRPVFAIGTAAGS